MYERHLVMGWLNRAKKKECRFLIVAHDILTGSFYPVFVKDEESYWEKIATLRPAGDEGEPFAYLSIKNHAEEVYDLNMDNAFQIEENRAWHAPSRWDA